jgi:hypothetical protein
MANKTWKELEAEGVERCHAVLYNRKTSKSRQCRRRATVDDDGRKWCERHGPAMLAARRQVVAAIEAELNYNHDDDDADD